LFPSFEGVCEYSRGRPAAFFCLHRAAADLVVRIRRRELPSIANRLPPPVDASTLAASAWCHDA
jgi:hypothetical protein